MKRIAVLFLVAVVMLGSAVAALAKEPEKKTEPAPAAQPITESDAAKQEKEVLIANINNMRNQELKVAVLQQVLTEAVGQLRQVQAVFCDQYKLDPEKWRKGEYRYDEKLGKFIEIKPSELMGR